MKTNFAIVQASGSTTLRLSQTQEGELIAVPFETEADARTHMATLDDAADLTVAHLRNDGIIPRIILTGAKRVMEQRKDGDVEDFDIPAYERFLTTERKRPAS